MKNPKQLDEQKEDKKIDRAANPVAASIPKNQLPNRCFEHGSSQERGSVSSVDVSAVTNE